MEQLKEWFGEMRSLVTSHRWDETLWSLLKRAHSEDPREYARAWGPYIAHALARQEARLEVHLGSVRQLEEHAGWLALSPLAYRFVHLDLADDNAIGREGVMALAALEHLTHLASLDLTGNAIGDGGAAALASSEYLCEWLRSAWRWL